MHNERISMEDNNRIGNTNWQSSSQLRATNSNMNQSKRYDRACSDAEEQLDEFKCEQESIEHRLENNPLRHKTSAACITHNDIITGELTLEAGGNVNNSEKKQFQLNVNQSKIKQRNAQISSSKSLHSELMNSKRKMRKKLDSTQIDEYVKNQRILMLFSNNECLPDHRKDINKCDLGNNASESEDLCIQK